MKKSLLILLMGFMQSALAVNDGSVVLPGGMLQFQGEIYSGTCTVNDSDMFLTVPMGQISSNQFKRAGDVADAVVFDIHFSYCNKNVTRNMAVVFHGNSDVRNPDLLALDDRDSTAKGIAIALYAIDGKFVPLNTGQIPVRPKADGPYTLHLVAKYRATQDNVSGGYASAQAWFTLVYE